MNTIADKLQGIVDSKAAISAAIIEKGGTVPAKLADFGDAIRAIPTPQPTLFGAPLEDVIDSQTGELFPNGPVNLVFELEDLPGYRNSLQYRFSFYLKSAPGATNLKSISFPNLSAIDYSTGVRSEFFHAFDNNTALTGVNFPVLSRIGDYSSPATMYTFNYAFNGCNSLTSVSFPSLTSIGAAYCFQYCFYNTSTIQKISFPALKEVAGNYAFDNIVGINTDDYLTLEFPALERIGTGTKMFTALNGTNGSMVSSLSFPELTSIGNGQATQASSPFGLNPGLTDIYLPKWSEFGGAGQYLFYQNNGLERIHCGSANEAAVKAMRGYGARWGAPTYCQILFDL